MPVITHDSTLTTARALRIEHAQDPPQQRVRWLQGAGIVAPVVLKPSHRLAAFCCVVGLVSPRLTLVEREAAHQSAASGKPIRGLKPNRRPDDRPKPAAWRHIVRHGTVTPVILAE